MKFNFRIFKVLLKKDLKNCFANKNILAALILPILFCGLYNYIYNDMGLIPNSSSFAATYVLMLCGIMVLAIVPLNILSTLVAEEKEKHTLRSLMLANVSSLEFLMSKAVTCEIIVIVDSILMGVVAQLEPSLIVGYVLSMLFSSLGVLFFGAIIGIAAKDQMSAGTLGSPLMLVLMLPPMMSDFSETLETIAKLFPTTSMKTLYTSVANNMDLFNSDNIIAAVVCIVWIVIGAVIFGVFYKKRGFDN